MKTIPAPSHSNNSADLAADVIRAKLDNLYADEPNAREELKESEAATHRSKHQQFMHSLGKSGKSLAEIQTAWHNYYIELPDHEKHEVWQEFYEEHDRRKKHPNTHQQVSVSVPTAPAQPVIGMLTPSDPRSVADVKSQLLGNIRAQKHRKKGGHLKSLAFGLASGFITVAILLFGFFNERFIAPFITPSKSVSATPIIIDPSSTNVGPNPEIIIPKINLEIPVVYDEPSIADDAVQNALERGVLHYATTPNPGELGNGAIFGHSSNNILNKGKYKFAFTLLKRLEVGDTFMLQKDGKRYVYRIFDKQIVKPQDVNILNADYGKPATFSLITCDPPGTSINRLVVTGEQITPDPGTAKKGTASSTPQEQPAILPSNSESLWHRLIHGL